MNDLSSQDDARQTIDSVHSVLPKGKQQARLRRWRGFKDGFARYGVSIGGLSVIAALALIFIYLFLETLPLFQAAEIETVTGYVVPGPNPAETLHLAMERYQEVGVRFTRAGEAIFFEPHSGAVRKQTVLPIPEQATVTSFASAELRTRMIAYGLSDGHVIVARHAYDISYPEGRRYVTPKLDYPLGVEPLVVDEQGATLTHIGIQEGGRGTAVAAATADGRLLLVLYTSRTSFLTGEVEVQRTAYELEPPPGPATKILINTTMSNLFVGDEQGRLHYYDIRRPAQASLVDSQYVVQGDTAVTAMDFLLGTVSIIVGGSDGSVSQWFLVRDEHNVNHLTRVREFAGHGSAITAIGPEHQRKGFVTADEDGHIGVHFATSHRTLAQERLVEGPIQYLAKAPRHDGLLALDTNAQMHFIDVHNPHPQVSWNALWNKVWYEGRAEPDYVWQSSGATDEFEPKLSMVPLTIGTLKAAFFAMLFAMPLAIMGAIYSAYFMTPKLRGVVKPTIEVMEALPTVILGFLAGLWLAPYVERNLPVVFSILILLPIGMLATSLLWSKLPWRVRASIPPGWEAALLVPVILGIGWLCVVTTPYLQIWLFDGDMRQWLTDIGISYDQRNALVVGIAMGFAVIPTIFSIAEDAVFNVPKHLTQGSLALGATPWQTVTGVVLLTASPGIFSAVMIGFGRAVGETMIVLMATGNSPVVNFNIFEGMRTLSANIAVEMPETAVGSTHFRILFLAALVLFAMTFAVNTIAEIVRQRLREKYSRL